jgi:hypothetical protein
MPAIDQTKEVTANVCWARDDADTKTFTIKDNTGVVIDISAWTFTMSVDSEKDPPDVTTLQFAMTGSLTTDGTDGKVDFTPAALDTDITPGKYFYDIQRNSPTKKTLIKGVAEIIMDITKT